MITVVETTNPFKPCENIVIENCMFSGSVLDWIYEYKSPQWEAWELPTVVIVNDKPIFQREYGTVMLKKGDILKLVVSAQGFTAIIIGIILVAISVAISLSIGAPEIPQLADRAEPDDVFSFGNQRNQNKLGQPIPSHYGYPRNWPDIAAQPYTRYEGNNQILYMLLCAGQGKYLIDPEECRFDDTPVRNFPSVEVSIYEPGEPAIAFDNDVQTSDEVSSIELYGSNEDEYLGSSGPFAANEVGTQITKIEVDIVFPRGLYFSADNGSLAGRQVTALWEYREIDDSGDPIGEWLTLVTLDETLATVTPQRFTKGMEVPAGRYEVRGVRTNLKDDSHRAGNEVVWESLKGFEDSTYLYGDVTMIAVKALATNSLNSTTRIDFNCRQQRLLRTYNPETEEWTDDVATRNPAWAMVDIFLAKYGAGLSENFLDLQSIYEVAQAWDANDITFDYSYTSSSSIWDAARLCLIPGRAKPMLNGSQVTLVREIPRAVAVSTFTPSNMVRNSFSVKMKMFGLNENDGIRAEYIDENTWKTEHVDCLVGNDEGNNLRTEQVHGILDRTKVYQLMMHVRAKEVFQRQVVSFETGLEGHLPGILSLSRVTHDAMNWNQHGLVTGVSVDGLTISLSEKIALQEDGYYKIAFRLKDGSASDDFDFTVAGERQILLGSPLPEIVAETFDRKSSQERVFYIIGTSSNPKTLCTVSAIRPLEDDRISIDLVNYDPRVFDYDNAVPPALDGSYRSQANPTVPVVTNLQVRGITTDESRVQLSWSFAPGANSYVIETSTDGEIYTTIAEVTATNYALSVIRGFLYIRVAGVGRTQGVPAIWSGFLNPTNEPPSPVTDLALRSAFTGNTLEIEFAEGADSASTIIEVRRLSDGLVMRTFETAAEIYDYTKDDAFDDFSGSPERSFTIAAISSNIFGQGTEEALLVTNPAPAAVGGITSASTPTANPDEYEIDVNWTPSADFDIKEYVIFASTTMGFVPAPGNEVFRGLTSGATFLVTETDPIIYFRIGAIDNWSNNPVNTAEQSLTL